MRFIIIIHIEWMITLGKTNLDDQMFPQMDTSHHVIYNHAIHPLDKVGLSFTLYLSIGEEEKKGLSQRLYFEVHTDHLKTKDDGPGIVG